MELSNKRLSLRLEVGQLGCPLVGLSQSKVKGTVSGETLIHAGGGARVCFLFSRELT
jgi:hypothetical protein